ncbi:MAG TPA: LysR family transcriptional regulator [Xanthobacteraceae bacterium]|nr:LysR family transcriptional regulator [Xanthobacteraceae bacterium]
MIEFKTLETFVWVANLRSFRGAAEKLHTTQPAVSMRIAQLEETLKVPLFERDRRRVAPTEKGRELIGYAERLLRLRAEMIEAVGDPSTMRGLVRLGVAETIVHTWLPAFIERVNTAYPNLELEIEVDISTNLHDRLVGRDLDLAFLLGPAAHPNIHSRPLCAFPLAFMAHMDIKLGKKPVALADIARHPVITYSRNTEPYAALRELFARAGLQPTIHASASLATVVHMALDGIGIATLPPAILPGMAARGRLRAIATEANLPSLNFVMSWPAAPERLAVRKVADIAAEVARAGAARR